jgi:MFS transporter, DHA3 family, macrolide efflux protein
MIQSNTQRPSLLPFMIIWSGETISLIGSGLSSFALSIWTFQQTGSLILFSFIALAGVLPAALVSPLAGSLVDRLDRRLVLIVCNAGLALEMLVLTILFMTRQMELWYVYVAVIYGAVLTTFLRPAFTASITLLVPEDQLGRVNGLVQLGQALAQMLAPGLAGVLVLTIQLQGVVLVDLVSYLFAIVTLILVHIPRPASSTEQGDEEKKSSLWADIAEGWTYITARTGLLALITFAALFNFLGAVPSVLIQPLVLRFSNAAGLGLVISLGGSGMLVGSLLLSIWKGPQRRILLLFGGLLVCGVCLVVAGLQPSLVLVLIGAFFFFFSLPAINSTITTIQQRKVKPEVQGRVFVLSNMIGISLTPVAYVLAGVLGDQIFEPLLQKHGLLASSVGVVIGTGPGRGIGFFFVVVGLLLVLLTIGGYLYPRLRKIEDELPDELSGEEKPVEALTNNEEAPIEALTNSQVG